MLKLKLDEVKPLNLELTFESPNIILAKTQKKEAIPTKEQQNITPDKGFDGLSEVTIYPIPDEYIIPTGELEITENGEYDVKDKSSAKVDIPEPTGTLEINANGTYNVKDKEFADVNVPEKKLGTKNITSNGVYKASDDGLDGYSEVDVETSGVDINDYFNTNYTSGNWQSLIKKIPKTTINTTNCNSMFNQCPITEIDEIVFTQPISRAISMFNLCKFKKVKLTNFELSNNAQLGGMFNSAYEINVLDFSDTDFSNASFISNMFIDCGYSATVEDGAYANGIPYVYVKNEEAQNWVLTAANGHPSNWSTNNVLIKE